MSTLETSRKPPLFHVRINRPGSRNAVDRPTAEALDVLSQTAHEGDLWTLTPRFVGSKG